MTELRKVCLRDALRFYGSAVWPKATDFNPVSRLFTVDYGTSFAYRPDLSEIGLEVVFSEEELAMQGRAGVLAEISKKSAELATLIKSWMTAPQ